MSPSVERRSKERSLPTPPPWLQILGAVLGAMVCLLVFAIAVREHVVDGEPITKTALGAYALFLGFAAFFAFFRRLLAFLERTELVDKILKKFPGK